ncbi:MAG TPA: hypothetical protein VF374_09160, partial [Thermoplasmata archaeon]
ILLSVYPYISSPIRKANPYLSLEKRYLPLLRKMNKKTKTVLYIVDLPIDQAIANGQPDVATKAAYKAEEKLLKNTDILMVFNDAMKDLIKERYGIEDQRFVEFQTLDYGVNVSVFKEKELPRKRVVTSIGTLANKKTLGALIDGIQEHEDIKWEFYGQEGEWISGLGRTDIVYEGFSFDQAELAQHLAEKSHFGLIWREPNPLLDKYHSLTSTSKFGAYVSAGVPVLVPARFAYISALAREHEVGIVFDSPSDIPRIVAGTTPKEYAHIRDKCLDLGAKLSSGYFFKNAVEEAMKRLSP